MVKAGAEMQKEYAFSRGISWSKPDRIEHPCIYTKRKNDIGLRPLQSFAPSLGLMSARPWESHKSMRKKMEASSFLECCWKPKTSKKVSFNLLRKIFGAYWAIDRKERSLFVFVRYSCRESHSRSLRCAQSTCRAEIRRIYWFLTWRTYKFIRMVGVQ